MTNITYVRSRYLNRRAGRLNAYRLSTANATDNFSLEETLDKQYIYLYGYKCRICPYRPRFVYDSLVRSASRKFKKI
jgi:hypothetical protein